MNDRIKQVLGALKSAQDAHPQIDFAGLEYSIAKRVIGHLFGKEQTRTNSEK